MKKTKKSFLSNSSDATAQIWAIRVGYSLFALLTLMVLLSTTMPMIRLLFSPSALHSNVILFVLFLTIGAITPLLVGYFIGARVLPAKSQTDRRFNGVAYGALAYWVGTLSAMYSWNVAGWLISSFSLSGGSHIVASSLAPLLVVCVVLSCFALLYKRTSTDTPTITASVQFCTIILSAIALTIILSSIGIVAPYQFTMPSLLWLLSPLFIGALSYYMIRATHCSNTSKVTWSALSISVAFICFSIVPTLISIFAAYINPTPDAQTQNIVQVVGWIIAIIVWAMYWRTQAKSIA